MNAAACIVFHVPENDQECLYRLENLVYVSKWFLSCGVPVYLYVSGDASQISFPPLYSHVIWDAREGFNKPRGYNALAESAAKSHEILLFAETDNFGSNVTLACEKALEKGWSPGWYNLAYTSRLSREKIMREYPSHNPRLTLPSYCFGQDGHEGGLIAFRRDVFHDLQGYDERYTGLGGMDNEIVCRASRIAQPRVIPKLGMCIHLWHPPSPMKQVRGNLDRLRTLQAATGRTVWRGEP